MRRWILGLVCVWLVVLWEMAASPPLLAQTNELTSRAAWRRSMRWPRDHAMAVLRVKRSTTEADLTYVAIDGQGQLRPLPKPL